MNKTNFKNAFVWILLIGQLIASSVLFISITNSNILPTKYILLLAVILFALLLVTVIFSLFNSWIKAISYIFGLFVIVVSIVGTVFVYKANATVEEITGEKEYYDEVVIVANVDSGINNLDQLKDKIVGTQTTFQPDLMLAAEGILREKHKLNFQTLQYNTVIEQILALQKKEVDAIIYNKSHESLILEQMPAFNNATKTVHVLNITSKDIDMYKKYAIGETVPEEPTEPVTDPTTTIPEINESTGTFAVYMSGIDVVGKINVNGRSDVNMLAIVNPREHKVLLINTPRDYFVPIPGVSGNKNDKLTHAGIYGVKASMDTLSALYNVPVDYYFRVNFTSFENIVDALGGIDVYSEYSFESRGAKFKKGINHLDGVDALKFCRERYSFADGDRQRGKNQQEVIKAIIKKSCSPAILTSAMSILESVRSNIDMSIPDDMIRDMIKQQLEYGGEWEIVTMSATGSNGSEEPFSMPGFKAYVMIPDPNSIQEIKDAIKEMYN